MQWYVDIKVHHMVYFSQEVMPMMIGQRLEQLRKNAGLNQNQLAHQAAVPRQVIARIESGQRDGDNMTVSVAKRLARALRVSVDHLVCVYEDEQTREPAPTLPASPKAARKAPDATVQAAPATVKRTRGRTAASRVAS
jgi:transcriptional regulator with XRE-family HTH domain